MFTIKSKAQNAYVCDITVSWSSQNGQNVAVGFTEDMKSKHVYKVDSREKLNSILSVLGDSGYDIKSLEIVEMA